MQQLSGLDASFLYFETANAPMHIGGIAIYDPSTVPGLRGPLRFKTILKNIEGRLHLARSFREKIVPVPLSLDHPYWIEDPHFDLEYHVRHIALPKPGDWRQLCIQAARLHSRPLDLSRPLWEMYVIEGLDNVEGLPPGSFAVVTKIHHAAIDGVSGAEITAVLHDLSPDPEPPPEPETPWVGEEDPSSWDLLARAAWNTPSHPFRFARLMTRTLPAVGRVASQMWTRQLTIPAAPGISVPRTRFNGTVSPHRVIDGRVFELAEVRAMKKAVAGATVNDVVLATVGGAMRRYLASNDELPEESLVAMAPISVRTEDEKGTQGNRVTAMAVALGTQVEDPLERLRVVHEGAVQSKALTNAIGARLMTDYTNFVPSSVAGLAARLYSRFALANRMRPMFNTVVTNVPGPQVPLYAYGARLVAQYGMGPILDGMGLIHPVFSYCGKVTIAVTSCRALMPDPAFYADCLQASFEELRAASGVTEVRAAAKPRAKAATASPAHAS
ncbi:MAG TPA: wax ester/triacylglycerol synthase family O-acyltransferase [Candidatus Binatia bacterium]|nr:wax ester/triacylglycerol synthase family O-acyltransferase [Candidatus Binatia bacterium]